jgi:hypothetical protein
MKKLYLMLTISLPTSATYPENIIPMITGVDITAGDPIYTQRTSRIPILIVECPTWDECIAKMNEFITNDPTYQWAEDWVRSSLNEMMYESEMITEYGSVPITTRNRLTMTVFDRFCKKMKRNPSWFQRILNKMGFHNKIVAISTEDDDDGDGIYRYYYWKNKLLYRKFLNYFNFPE